MRILWLYRYIESYDFDNWLHLKFVEVIKQQPGIEIMVYGPEIHKGYPHLTTLPYSSKIHIDDIQKHFNFDVIILNTKSRMFFYYNPHDNVAEGEWTPLGTATHAAPKIVIEEDYHYEKNDEWYRNNRIAVILQRHYSQFLRQAVVPMQWFPFSVDTAAFAPQYNDKRLNKICLVGSTTPNSGVYGIRNRASELLQQHALIDRFVKKERIGQAYIECLRRYVSHLSCNSTYKLTPAKMFEIMAGGSVLLTNESDDLKLLFPEDSYRTYKEDLSNLVVVAKDITTDSAKRIETANKGLATVREKHSHSTRIEELKQIIEKLQKGS